MKIVEELLNIVWGVVRKIVRGVAWELGITPHDISQSFVNIFFNNLSRVDDLLKKRVLTSI